MRAPTTLFAASDPAEALRLGHAIWSRRSNYAPVPATSPSPKATATGEKKSGRASSLRRYCRRLADRQP